MTDLAASIAVLLAASAASVCALAERGHMAAAGWIAAALGLAGASGFLARGALPWPGL